MGYKQYNIYVEWIKIERSYINWYDIEARLIIFIKVM